MRKKRKRVRTSKMKPESGKPESGKMRREVNERVEEWERKMRECEREWERVGESGRENSKQERT